MNHFQAIKPAAQIVVITNNVASENRNRGKRWTFCSPGDRDKAGSFEKWTDYRASRSRPGKNCTAQRESVRCVFRAALKCRFDKLRHTNQCLCQTPSLGDKAF